MHMRDKYRDGLRTLVEPALRDLGFKGGRGRWSIASPQTRDMGLVEFQSDHPKHMDVASFTVNIGIVAAPIEDFYAYRSGGKRRPARALDGIWSRRLTPGDSWWMCQPTSPTATSVPAPPELRLHWWGAATEAHLACAFEDVMKQLETDAAPQLRRLLDRHELIASIEAGLDEDADRAGSLRHLALLFADEGRTKDDERVLTAAANDPHGTASSRNQARASQKTLYAWIRDSTVVGHADGESG